MKYINGNNDDIGKAEKERKKNDQSSNYKPCLKKEKKNTRSKQLK